MSSNPFDNIESEEKINTETVCKIALSPSGDTGGSESKDYQDINLDTSPEKASKEQEKQLEKQVSSRDDNTMDSRRTVYPCICIWVPCYALLFIVIMIGYTLVPFLEQQLNDQCTIINNSNGNQIRTLYYFMFSGVSSSSTKCVNDQHNFCISWQDKFWDNFDNISTNALGNSDNTSYNWLIAQILVPIASILVFGILLLNIYTYYNHHKISKVMYLVCISTSSIAVLLSTCSLLFVSIMLIARSNSTNDLAWFNFYQNLYINPNDNYPISAESSSCTVRMLYIDGAAFLSTALAINFILMFGQIAGTCAATFRVDYQREWGCC